jgi:SPP1 gp7 family putative phage head morphogenesis protein
VAVNRELIVEEIRARRAWLKATGRLNRRRPMPRQQAPDAIRLSYLSALLSGPVARARELVRERLEPRLPGLAAEAAAARGDAVERLDETAGDVNALLDRIADEWFGEWPNERLAALARRFADRTSEFQREQLARQFKAAMGIDVFRSEPWLGPKVSAFTAENVALIKSVAQDHFTDLEKRMISGLRSGQRWEDLADTARERYGVSENRAKLIARDQVGKLYGELNRTRQKELGVSRYTWRTSRDNRVRDEHEAREGEVFSWDDPPEDGHPGEPVQCRCNADPVLEDLLAEMGTHAPEAAPVPAEAQPEGGEGAATPVGGAGGGGGGEEPPELEIPAEVNAIVDRLMPETAAEEPAISAAMRALETEGQQLVGFGLRVKGRGSLARKIATDAQEQGITYEQAAAKVGDRVRFTLQLTEGRYSAGVVEMLSSLESQGFEVYRFKNTWGSGGVYQGVNVNLRTHNGITIELQFHTEQSFEAKEHLNHKLYEERRLPTTPEDRKSELDRLMIENQDRVPKPEGAVGLRWPPKR